jgi:hypothetical protein
LENILNKHYTKHIIPKYGDLLKKGTKWINHKWTLTK